MLVAFWHTVPRVVITILVSALLGWTPDPMGLLAAGMALLLVAVLLQPVGVHQARRVLVGLRDNRGQERGLLVGDGVRHHALTGS